MEGKDLPMFKFCGCLAILPECPPNKLEADRYYRGNSNMCEIIAKEILEDLYSCGPPDDIRMERSFAAFFFFLVRFVSRRISRSLRTLE